MIPNDQSLLNTAVLQVVRGSRTWPSLSEYGILKSGDTWMFPPCTDPLVVTLSDLVAGLSSLASDRELARQWACFILAASNVISFEYLENDPKGQQMIEVLWQLAECD